MSLLMDALRKAEQQKQQGSGTAGSAHAGRESEGLALEPMPKPEMADARSAATRRGDKLPELPQRMEELDEQFFTIPPAPGKTSTTRGPATPRSAISGKAAAEAARADAQNLFAAKQPVAPIGGHGFAVGVGVATLVAIVAIGIYFYWQLQPKGGLTVSPAVMASPPSPAAPQLPEKVAVAPLPPATNPVPATSPMPALPSITTAKPQQAPAATMPTTSRSERLSDAPVAPPSSERPRQADTAAVPNTASDIRLHPSKRPAKGDDTPEAAYAAFIRGEYERAHSLWLAMLRSDARNLDALLGLAALAQQGGKLELAEQFFRKAIEVDPKNPAANAGLFATSPPSDPRQAESHLKGLLAEQPDAPQLHFALGNLYLGESRWAEAQQAFFKAHVADPDNADILYNLAVSLDHLHQERLAAQYYTRALAAARSGPANFDPALAETRLQTLQAAQGR